MKKLGLLFLLLLLTASTAHSQALDRAHINFINPLDFAASCTQTSLQAALTFAGSNKVTVFLPKTDRAKVPCTWTLTSDLTTNFNTTFWIPAGSVLIPNANVIVTFNGPLRLDDPDSLQGAGNYVFNYPRTQDTASYVASGCFPTVPFSSLTFPAFSCTGGITLNSSHLPISQEAAAVGPFTSGAGTYWIMLDYSRTRGITGWTRQAGTHYLWKYSATQPAFVSGTIQFAQVTVTSSITAVADVASYRIFTDQVAFTAPITTGAQSTWFFQPGAALVAGAPVSIGGSIINDSNQQIFLPGAQVTFSSSFKQPVLVDWFGAKNDGSVDGSSAINEAIASLPLHGHLKFGKGRYLVTASLTPFFNTIATGQTSTSVLVTCDGKDSTQILFNPISTATLFSWSGTNVSSRMASSGIRDCSVYSNATVAKTVLYIGNVDDFIVNDVLLNNTGSGSGDTTGVAMHVDKDPQSLAFTNVTIYNYPHGLKIGTAAAVQTYDHMTFNKLFILNVNQNPSVNSLIEVMDGSQLQQVNFYDTIGVGGNGLFKWVSTTTPPTDGSSNLLFSGGRYEDGGLTTAGITLRVEPHVTKKLANLRVTNMSLGTPGAGTNLYLRNCSSVTIQDVVSTANSEATLYNFNDTNDNLLFLNHTSTNLLSTEVVGGNMKKILGSGRDTELDNRAEPIKFYQTVNAIRGIQSRYLQVISHRIWTDNPEIAQSASFTIPPVNSELFAAQIFLSFNANGGTAGGCHFTMFEETTDNTAVKISGTSNCVGGVPSGGEMGVYRNAGDDTIKVTNLTGVTKLTSILVFYIEKNPLP